ncbi:MAG: hypothetical protein JWN16_1495 [Alphaproteobacteria bacterium]|nr:hypothetical protein [Alphaproteobacteria bacterium]
MKAVIALLLLTASAQAAHQDWTVVHQTDRFVDRVMMEAWADADAGKARMMLYCDTETGFRVMFAPHRKLLGEGPARLTLTIDSAKPVTLGGDAFGDDETDVVTLHDAGRIQKALSGAHHVAVTFEGDGLGEDSFSFGDLAAQRAALMKTCPVR